MKVVSLVGILLAIIGFGRCSAGVLGDNADIFNNLSDLTSRILNGIENQVTLNNGRADPVVQDKVVSLVQAGDRQPTEQQQQQEEEEEGRRGDASAGMVFHNETLHRKRRQVVNVRIPTLLGHVTGRDDPPNDVCPRAEVMVDEECHQVLTQGPCDDDEVVLINPNTRQGFCGSRLCPLDKVFVHSDQLCHDPLEYGLCPPGRQLFSSSYGTPVCACPDGTYEEEDDLDEDVCEPVLGHNECPAGQVFWFSDFKRPVGCRPDPCNGLNLKRGPTDLPYVPALYDRKCYRIGTQPFFCKSDELFSISFEKLKGVCTTLEDAGFKVLDSDVLSFLDTTFGSSANTASYRKTYKTQKTKLTPASTTLLRRPEVGEAVMHADEDEEDAPSHLSIGQSAVPGRARARHPRPSDNEVSDDDLTPLHTHLSAFSPSYITVGGRTVTFLNLLQGLTRPHSRHRRAPLPFASPGNVFEPGLSACRAGARRDGNAKCRETVLPGRYPPSRARRSVPPVPAHPACPTGSFRALTRKCVSSKASIASSINALGLG